jgi:hypothetical protein
MEFIFWRWCGLPIGDFQTLPIIGPFNLVLAGCKPKRFRISCYLQQPLFCRFVRFEAAVFVNVLDGESQSAQMTAN